MNWRFAVSAFAFCVFLSRAPAAEISAIPLDKPGQGVIILNGDIVLEDREQFLIKIAPFSGGLVVLNSGGGSAYAGIEIGKAIRLRGFTTWVPSGSLCASACAMAWLGGTRRLMGKSALVGFHSVYLNKDGHLSGSSSGNALYGAYLSQLGLSEAAIAYLSAAAPTSMNWLTPAQAEGVGISLAIYDPPPTPKTSPPAPQQAEPMEKRSRDFVIALHVLISGPTDKFLGILPGAYADQVLYYGKETAREDVIAQITSFTGRWPERSYAVTPNTLSVQCDKRLPQCRVTGLVSFDAKSIARNQRSHGIASFDYLLAFRQGAKWPLIVSESGKVVTRQVDALNGQGGIEAHAVQTTPFQLKSH